MANTAGKGPNLAAGTDPQGTQGQDPGQKVDSAEKRAAQSGEPQFFEGTVVKIDKDGNEVMSDHVGPGEKLKSATDPDNAFTTVRHSEEKAPANEYQRQQQADAAQNKDAEEK